MRPVRTAILIDFGGVLTSSVLDAIGDFGEQVCGDRALPLHLLTTDPEAQRLHVDREEGRITVDEFEARFADRLRHHGVTMVERGFVADITSRIVLDPTMLDLVHGLRAGGMPVGLISNSLGDDDYHELDLPAAFDAVAISGLEGVRKPSRRLYEIACARLGVTAEEVVMIDDLPQNVDAARRLGMAGIVHRSHAETVAELSRYFPSLSAATVS
jgi:putative hydrolase of the HAD superfamily